MHEKIRDATPPVNWVVGYFFNFDLYLFNICMQLSDFTRKSFHSAGASFDENVSNVFVLYLLIFWQVVAELFW